MTFIGKSEPKLEKKKIWLILGLFLQKRLNFRKQEPVEIVTLFHHQYAPYMTPKMFAKTHRKQGKYTWMNMPQARPDFKLTEISSTCRSSNTEDRAFQAHGARSVFIKRFQIHSRTVSNQSNQIFRPYFRFMCFLNAASTSS